jgi:hypothetical protein
LDVNEERPVSRRLNRDARRAGRQQANPLAPVRNTIGAHALHPSMGRIIN